MDLSPSLWRLFTSTENSSKQDKASHTSHKSFVSPVTTNQLTREQKNCCNFMYEIHLLLLIFLIDNFHKNVFLFYTFTFIHGHLSPCFGYLYQQFERVNGLDEKWTDISNIKKLAHLWERDLSDLQI